MRIRKAALTSCNFIHGRLTLVLHYTVNFLCLVMLHMCMKLHVETDPMSQRKKVLFVGEQNPLRSR